MDAGIRVQKKGKKFLSFLTLTSSNDRGYEYLTRDFQVMLRQLKRDHQSTKNSWQYVKVKTSEGNGVLHVIVNWPYIKRAELSALWEKIHLAWSVDIRRLWYGRGLKNYLTPHLSDQGRLSSSRSWVYKGWRAVYNGVRREYWYEYMPGLVTAPYCLAQYIIYLYTTFSEKMMVESLNNSENM